MDGVFGPLESRLTGKIKMKYVLFNRAMIAISCIVLLYLGRPRRTSPPLRFSNVHPFV